jgi:phospholipid transport system substrate-binding protein
VAILAGPAAASETGSGTGSGTGTAGQAPAAIANDEPPATRIVDRLYDALLGVMRRADELGFEGRRERLEPVLETTFDFPFMAEKSAGRYWKSLDEAQRQQLVDALSRLAIATYAARFSGFDGERFETLGQESATFGTVLVKTHIVQGDGQTVALDYRLRRLDDGDWRIIDVFLDGTVSELALRRAEYTSVIKRDGFDALLEALDEKANDQGDDRVP